MNASSILKIIEDIKSFNRKVADYCEARHYYKVEDDDVKEIMDNFIEILRYIEKLSSTKERKELFDLIDSVVSDCNVILIQKQRKEHKDSIPSLKALTTAVAQILPEIEKQIPLMTATFTSQSDAGDTVQSSTDPSRQRTGSGG